MLTVHHTDCRCRWSPANAAFAAIALTIAMGTAYAADPRQFSPAEQLLFMDDHLGGVKRSATLEYTFSKRGSLEAPIDDTARLVVGPPKPGGDRPVKVEYLSAARKLELPDIDAARGNPMILYFLEREIREMHRITGGSAAYYRKRIRMALADGGQVDTATVTVGSRRVAATTIRISPYRDDPARSRYEKFAEKSYIFTLSDEVPGKVVELRGELLGPSDAAGIAQVTVIAETLRYSRAR
jgi:hypothetical protein